MADQLPIIGESRAINTGTTASTSLIGRGLSAILNKEIGLAKSDLDARYRQARDIYNRITDDDVQNRFKIELLPTQSELLEDPRLLQLQPFYNLIKQLTDIFTVFQQLADVGYGKAYFPLANMYRGGQGISTNIDKADYYSHKAFDWCFANKTLNDSELWTDLGRMYANGWVAKKDNEGAVFWYRKAAEQCDAEAQYNLGCMSIIRGHDTLQDYEQAVFWYRKAAKQDHANAQSVLGSMYATSQYMMQDDEQAVFWYRKVAEQGDALGQYYLGQMYAKGQGVEQDDKQAVFWYLKAAKQGNEDAQEKLTTLGINWKNN